MVERVVPLSLGTGVAIRDFLLRVGVGSPYDFFREFREVKPTTSYGSIRRYFYILKRLGLIEFVGAVPSERGGFPKRTYRIVPRTEEDPRWDYPQIALYPLSGFGGKKGKQYRRWVERGRPKKELETLKRKYSLI